MMYPRPTWLETAETNYTFHKSFPKNIRDWIQLRDNYTCQMPTIKDAKFVSYASNVEINLNVHHILPRAYMNRFTPNMNPHHILNGITLSPVPHTGLHTDFLQEIQDKYNLKKPEGMTAHEFMHDLASKGYPLWDTRYDEYLSAIACTNSYLMLREGKFPFINQWKEDVKDAFHLTYKYMPEFVDSYLRNK